MIDAHNHLQFAAFDHDRTDTIKRAAQAGLKGMIVAGYDSQRRALAAHLSNEPGIGATCGLHPWACADPALVDAELDRLADAHWASFCGIGECGLDFARATTAGARTSQSEIVRFHLALSRDLDLPVVFHCVRANDELANLIAADGISARGGLVHGFWGSVEQARRFTRLGLKLGVGHALRQRARAAKAAAFAHVGVDHLVVETDCPTTFDDGSRGEPSHLPCVVRSLALLLGTEEATVAETTAANARELFQLRGELAAV